VNFKLAVVEGERYSGQMNGDEVDGIGRACLLNKGIYEGLFKDGEPHTYGRFIYKNKSYYEGQYKDGKKHG